MFLNHYNGDFTNMTLQMGHKVDCHYLNFCIRLDPGEI